MSDSILLMYIGVGGIIAIVRGEYIFSLELIWNTLLSFHIFLCKNKRVITNSGQDVALIL